MSGRLTASLADLADRDIRPNDLTADEIESLVRACERVENPYSRLRADLMERPVRVTDSLFLWPPTAGATVWLSEYAAAWWGAESWLGRWSSVYALANGRDRDAFTDDRAEMRRRVMRFALRLNCHRGELFDAVARCYGFDGDEPPEPPRRNRAERRAEQSAARDFVRIVAKLEAGSGIRQDEWLWGRSVDSLIRSYVALSELAAAALGGGTDARREADFELDAAIQHLARVTAGITRRVKAEREGKPADGKEGASK